MKTLKDVIAEIENIKTQLLQQSQQQQNHSEPLHPAVQAQVSAHEQIQAIIAAGGLDTVGEELIATARDTSDERVLRYIAGIAVRIGLILDEKGVPESFIQEVANSATVGVLATK